MFSPGVRLVLVFLAAGLGVWQLFQQRMEGLIALAAAVILASGYFRHGSVYAAFAAYRDGDVERAQQLLGAVPDPLRLTAQDQAYYHWLKGILLSHQGEAEGARTELERAIKGRLRTENDRSLVHCHLAELALEAMDLGMAEQHLQHARHLRHKPEVDSLIHQLQDRRNQAT